MNKFDEDFQNRWRGPLEVEVARYLYGGYSGQEQPWEALDEPIKAAWIVEAKELCDIFDDSEWANIE